MDFRSPLLLTNHYQHYEWGTDDEIPDLFAVPQPEKMPLAEYWVGAHPLLPSLVTLPEGVFSLNELIASYPQEILGEHHGAMKSRLPYLLKLISAAKPMSVQVHPDQQQASAGYERERHYSQHQQKSYSDTSHKSEFVMAVTPMIFLLGFREPVEIARIFRFLNIRSVAPWLSVLEKNDPSSLEMLFGWLLQSSGFAKQRLIEEVLASCSRLPQTEYQWVISLYQIFGDDDIGIIFPLILNMYELTPGEAVFIGSGVPHSFLSGTGVEVSTNSDNVIRCCLTGKHTDLQEIMQVTRFRSDEQHRVLPEQAPGISRYPVPLADFQFDIVDQQDGDSPGICPGQSGSAELLLVLDGELAVEGLKIRRGDAVLLPAAMGSCQPAGTARYCRVYTQIQTHPCSD